MTERRDVEGAGRVRLAVDVLDGTKPLGFLLVHGLASNARLWDGVARSLAASGYPSAAVDLRGHGRSDKPDDGYDYATMCADLVAVMESFGVGRIVAVGQSFGGNLVLELAARAPGLLAGVACVDGGMLDLAGRFERFEDAVAVLSPPQIAGTPASEMEAMMRSMHPDWPEEGIAGSMANFEVRPDGTVAPWLTLERHLAILRTMWGSRPRDLYARISVPVLFMPADSPGTPEWTAEKRAAVDLALAALPDATVRWFSPADHDVHAQHPEEVATALVKRFGPLVEEAP